MGLKFWKKDAEKERWHRETEMARKLFELGGGKGGRVLYAVDLLSKQAEKQGDKDGAHYIKLREYAADNYKMGPGQLVEILSNLMGLNFVNNSFIRKSGRTFSYYKVTDDAMEIKKYWSRN